MATEFSHIAVDLNIQRVVTSRRFGFHWHERCTFRV